MMEAIRYGGLPEVRALLHEVIDAQVGEGPDQLIAGRPSTGTSWPALTWSAGGRG